MPRLLILETSKCPKQLNVCIVFILFVVCFSVPLVKESLNFNDSYQNFKPQKIVFCANFLSERKMYLVDDVRPNVMTEPTQHRKLKSIKK